MKGQMSLEMIIGLLILLVVAFTVIRLFLGNITVLENIKDVTKTTTFRNFRSKCEQYCNDFLSSGNPASGVKFCSEKLYKTGTSNAVGLKGVVDIVKPEDIEATEALSVCEDGIYCFHVTPCESEEGSVEWADCVSILCNYFYKSYKDLSKASQKVKEAMEGGPGTCSLPKDPTENWYLKHFGDDPCGGGTTTPTSSSASLSCDGQGGTSMKCTWSGCTNSPCTLTCSKQGGQCEEPQKSVGQAATYTYISLKSGSTYTFNLYDTNGNLVAGPITKNCC
ncbi:hypothetical protein HZB88_03230 [archaeon]|nr:hypothetical protein [archaeon]